MTIVGGILESKDIGLPIGLSGTYYNTKIDETTGHLTLIASDSDALGNPVYVEEGHWISDTINLGDKFNDFDKLFTTEKQNGASSFSVQTRVSDNGYDWSEWVAIAMDGTIQSETKQYIQIKINLYAGFVTDVFLISDFENVDDVSLFDNNNFIETTNGLRLKREHELDMTLDTAWTGEGSLHRKLIKRDEWVRIDKMNVLTK